MVVLITTTVIAYLLLIISGVSKAIMDKINFHYSESVFVTLNGLFWNPVYSWMNKYKEGIDKRYKDTIVCMLEKKNSNDATTANTIEDTVSNCGVLFKF